MIWLSENVIFVQNGEDVTFYHENRKKTEVGGLSESINIVKNRGFESFDNENRQKAEVCRVPRSS